jgi:hypothetical protein
VVVRPIYTPALVAFLEEPSVGPVGIGPVVGWVALGWGEPCVPWWGRGRHAPSWRGWGGPRVVNNVVVTNMTVVNVQNITVYRNATVQNAVVAVDKSHFGHGPITRARITQVDVQRLQPIHAALPVAATPASFVPTASRGLRPPEESLKRPVVATRPLHAGSVPEAGATVSPAPVPRPAPHLVSVPRPPANAPVPPRPSFGQSPVERPMPDRARPPSPPKLNPPPGAPPSRPGWTQGPPMATPAPGTPAVTPGRTQGPSVASPPMRSLPGEPANHVAPHRIQGEPGQPEKPGG